MVVVLLLRVFLRAARARRLVSAFVGPAALPLLRANAGCVVPVAGSAGISGVSVTTVSGTVDTMISGASGSSGVSSMDVSPTDVSVATVSIGVSSVVFSIGVSSSNVRPSASSTAVNISNGLLSSAAISLSGVNATVMPVPLNSSLTGRKVPTPLIVTLCPSARASSTVAKSVRKNRRAVLLSTPVTAARRVMSCDSVMVLFIA